MRRRPGGGQGSITHEKGEPGKAEGKVGRMGIDLGKFTRKKNGVGSRWEQLGRGGSCPLRAWSSWS